VLLTRSPLEYPPKGAFPLDLHVLSTPPAFVLSQDQTLHRKPIDKKPITDHKHDQLANNRQNHCSSINSKKPNHPHQPHPTKTRQDQQKQTEVQQTNQFIDKHTVEFSKIRRATTPPGEGLVLRAGMAAGAGSPLAELAPRRSLATEENST
jgi:hypothetical protein